MDITRERYIAGLVKGALPGKMAFIGGPRQVGKTTFSKWIGKRLAKDSGFAYLNWDIVKDRRSEKQIAGVRGRMQIRRIAPVTASELLQAADVDSPFFSGSSRDEEL